MKFRFSIIAIALAALLSSCGNGSSETILPSISGKAGEVAVVCSKVEWEAEPGNTVRELLTQEVPYLPQVEPMYDLFNVPQQAFNKIFQVHRNIILIDTDPSHAESKFIAGSDVWASPQLVMKVEAPDAAAATEVIRQHGSEILRLLASAERSRVIVNSKASENAALRTKVNNMIGGSPYFPKGFSVKKETDNFLWISSETTFTIQGILIWKYPCTSETDFTPEALAAKRNEITKAQIPCTTENSYMILNPAIFPGYEYISLNGREVVEMRGLWEAYNDFMGGPFVSHSFLSRDGKWVITLDAFVYAPKYDKRAYIRQVESLLYSFDWNNLEAN